MRERREKSSEASTVHVAIAHSELAQVLEEGGIQGTSSAVARTATLGLALEEDSDSQLVSFPCDVVPVTRWDNKLQHGESHDFHVKQQPGEVCQETLHSVKAIRSAAEVGTNIAWICPLRAVKQTVVAGGWPDQAAKEDLEADSECGEGWKEKTNSAASQGSTVLIQCRLSHTSSAQCLDAGLLLSLKFDVLEVKKRKVLQGTCYLLPSKHHHQELSHLEVISLPVKAKSSAFAQLAKILKCGFEGLV